MILQIVVLIFVVSLVISGTVSGQITNFVQRSWTAEHGLPANQITALLQTQDGYLWVGTKFGLARFDGVRFTIFNQASNPEFPSDEIYTLAEDDEHNLWIALAGGVVRRKDGVFTGFGKADGLVDVQIGPLYPSRSHGLWVGAFGGLSRYADRRWNGYKSADGLLADYVTALHEDSSGKLWIGTHRGLQRLDPANGRFYSDFPPHEHGTNQVHAIYAAADQSVWIATTQPRGTSHLCQMKDGKWVHDAAGFATVDGHTLVSSGDQPGSFWRVSAHWGIERLLQHDSNRLTLRPDDEAFLILSMAEDRDGNLWIGTQNAGLHCWRFDTGAFSSVRQGLPVLNVWTLAEGMDGTVWIGTDRGLFRLAAGQMTNVTGIDSLIFPESNSSVRSVVVDRDGKVWIGTQNGLDVIERGELRQLPLVEGKRTREIRVIVPARDGSLWVGSEGGLHLLRDGRWSLFTTANGLINERVRVLLEDRSGALWIGTRDGLQRLSGNNFENFAGTNGFPQRSVFAFAQDSQGILWIGTDHGLARFKEGRFKHFSASDGLFDHTVYSILEDDFGQLWLGTGHGVVRVTKSELNDVAEGRAEVLHATTYTQADGLPAESTSGREGGPTACRMKDGRLWFGTPNGVAIIDPRQVRKVELPPLVHIEAVFADGEVKFSNDPVGVLKQDPPRVRGQNSREAHNVPIVHRAGARVDIPSRSAHLLEFQFTANSFITPERMQFKYRLEGLDERWIDSGTRRAAQYTRLRPGHYSFHVTASAARQTWNEGETALAIYIVPSFPQTWWFRGGCGVSLLLAGYAFVRWRLNELHKIQRLKREAALTHQREQIARDLHDEIGASLTQIAQLSEENHKSSALSERADSQAQKIAALAEQAVNHISEIVWANNPKYNTLEDTVAYLREYAANFLSTAALTSEFAFPETVPARQVPGEFRRHLLLVVKEALNNVMKHSGATRVSLSLTLREDQLNLSVSDNGRGLAPEPTSRFGNGLSNMRQRVTELGGTFKLHSPPGSGTEIKIAVKLPPC